MILEVAVQPGLFYVKAAMAVALHFLTAEEKKKKKQGNAGVSSTEL